MTQRILVVEDERKVAADLGRALEGSGLVVEQVSDGKTAWFQGDTENYDLVVLDLGLPNLDGLQVLKRWRANQRTMPVLVLTARDSWSEKVEVIDAGADDYLTKPFHMAELLARARAALRRHSRSAGGEHIVQAGPLLIDLAARTVSVDGVRVRLSPKEYRLLQVLAQHAGNVVTHQHLLKEVWGVRHAQDAHYLRIFVRKLRYKIERDPTQPRILVTELGVGYRLVQDVAR